MDTENTPDGMLNETPELNRYRLPAAGKKIVPPLLPSAASALASGVELSVEPSPLPPKSSMLRTISFVLGRTYPKTCQFPEPRYPTKKESPTRTVMFCPFGQTMAPELVSVNEPPA